MLQPFTRCTKPCCFLQALPVLQAKFAIKRALMRLQIQVPKSCKSEALELLDKLHAEVESRDFSSSQVSQHLLSLENHSIFAVGSKLLNNRISNLPAVLSFADLQKAQDDLHLCCLCLHRCIVIHHNNSYLL